MFLFCGIFGSICEFTLIALIALKVYERVTLGVAKSNVCLIGKTVLITGGNSGLGYQTALVLASRGAKVIIADVINASETKEKIIKETHNQNIITKYIDLASFDSVRKFAKEINETEERLDILINNAGVGGVTNIHTKDGILLNMQINHFGGFLLTHLLIDLMKRTGEARIIFVSSLLAFTNNLTVENLNEIPKFKSPWARSLYGYGNSKCCNIITSNGFAEKLKGTGITSNSIHPGVVNTPIYANAYGVSMGFKFFVYNMFRFYGKSAWEGAQTHVYCALENKLKNTTGKFFSDCSIRSQPSKARDEKFCAKIWKKSEELVKLHDSEKL